MQGQNDHPLMNIISNNYNKVVFISILIPILIWQLTMPIKMLDTDMWYHMLDGRYILEHFEVPFTYYYSFFDYDGFVDNHTWLTQVSMYLTHEYTGYWGLIIYRASLFSLIMFFLFLSIKNNQKDISAWALIIFFLATLILAERFYQLRPHAFTLLYIPITHLLLQNKKNWKFLPLLFLAWANTHGIEWIIGAFIVFAHIVELMITARKNKDETKALFTLIVIFSISLSALIINPMGIRLFTEPFDTSPDFSMFVNEMKPFSIEGLTSLNFIYFIPTISTARNTLVFIIFITLITRLLKNRHDLKSIILLAGSLYLLSKGFRFIFEAALISAPYIATLITNENEFIKKYHKKIIVALCVYFSMTIYLHFIQPYSNTESLPISLNRLPEAETEFLTNNDFKGRVLAPAGESGYIAWKTYPNIEVFSDMKHKDFITFYNINSYQTEPGFENTLDKYKPNAVLVPVSKSNLHEALIENGFSFAYAGDVFSVYISNNEKTIEKLDIKPDQIDDKETPLNILKYLSEASNKSLFSSYHYANRLYAEKRYKESLETINRSEKYFPSNKKLLFLKAEVLYQTEEINASTELLKKILDDHPNYTEAGLLLASCYFSDGKIKDSYKTYKRYLNPYTKAKMITPIDMYQYTFAAAIEGDFFRVQRNIEMSEFIYKDAEMLNKIKSIPGMIDETDLKQKTMQKYKRILFDATKPKP